MRLVRYSLIRPQGVGRASRHAKNERTLQVICSAKNIWLGHLQLHVARGLAHRSAASRGDLLVDRHNSGVISLRYGTCIEGKDMSCVKHSGRAMLLCNSISSTSGVQPEKNLAASIVIY